MPSPLEDMANQIEDEGFEPGTNRYEFRFLELRVSRCQELQEVTLCSECQAYLGCDLTREHQRWKKFGPPEPKKPCGTTSGAK